MVNVYCAECGTRLTVVRKVYNGVIVDVVNAHECLPEPIPLDLQPVGVMFSPMAKGKFVQKMNDLYPPKPSTEVFNVKDEQLRDRRGEKDGDVKTSAPENVTKMLKTMED